MKNVLHSPVSKKIPVRSFQRPSGPLTGIRAASSGAQTPIPSQTFSLWPKYAILEAPENSFHTVDACVALEGPLLCLARLPDPITHHRLSVPRADGSRGAKTTTSSSRMPASPRILSDHPPLLWQHSLPQRALSALDNSQGQKGGFSRAMRREGRLEDETGRSVVISAVGSANSEKQGAGHSIAACGLAFHDGHEQHSRPRGPPGPGRPPPRTAPPRAPRRTTLSKREAGRIFAPAADSVLAVPLAAPPFAALRGAQIAHLSSQVTTLETERVAAALSADYTWILTRTMAILTMQGGFGMLESSMIGAGTAFQTARSLARSLAHPGHVVGAAHKTKAPSRSLPRLPRPLFTDCHPSSSPPPQGT